MRTSHLAILASVSAAAAIAFAAAGASSPAFAATDVSVAAFKAVELHDGGEVLIRPGAQQHVAMVEGDPRFTTFHVDREGKLRIETDCNHQCPHEYRIRIEIVTPHLLAAAVEQGGSIKVVGNWPHEKDVAAAVRQGGAVDMRAIHATNAAAAVHEGGSVMVTADENLAAAVHEGGQVTFWGHPANITRAVSGGGQIRAAEMSVSEMHGRAVSVTRNHGHTVVNVENDAADSDDVENDNESNSDEDNDNDDYR
jgi:hypothetical protein